MARRRLGWAIAASVMIALALIPPVRAAVVELLHIGGVVVREEPRPTQLPTSPAPASGPATGVGVSVSEAQRLIGADIAVPAALGAPSSVVVLHDGRVAELVWSSAAGRPQRCHALRVSSTRRADARVGRTVPIWRGDLPA